MKKIVIIFALILTISQICYAGPGDFLITIFNATDTQLLYKAEGLSSGFIRPMQYVTIESSLQRPPVIVEIFNAAKNWPFYNERVPTHNALVVTGQNDNFKVWKNIIPA